VLLFDLSCPQFSITAFVLFLTNKDDDDDDDNANKSTGAIACPLQCAVFFPLPRLNSHSHALHCYSHPIPVP